MARADAGDRPPGIRAVQTIVTRRRIDTLAVFTLSILVLSVAMSFLTGSPRFLLAKDGWLTAAAGIWMLITLARTPFIFQIVRTLLPKAARERAEINWRDSPTYRHVIRVITTMWGVVLILDAGVRGLLAYALPVSRVPLISGLQYLGVYLVLEVTTRLLARRKSVAAAVEAESGQEYLK
ncbi:VC0807 family protein [Amycolatopsis sp.]|uniref:VC0807 family protein n=1 Tax=Amycolatopsis sp. TaxID=37632 RepID=UPI002BB914D5|nr:VC0807 family protein [Amycolatopsis sp.]HVV08440.1 VC0807 family protein [Amycolatopsis sp.]